MGLRLRGAALARAIAVRLGAERCRNSVLLLASALLCAACTTRSGRDFARPNDANLVFGQTTEADVITLEGQPSGQTITTMREYDAAAPSGFDWAEVGGRYGILRYRYHVALVGGPSDYKDANFIFWNGRLAGWAFLDGLPGETTDFDIADAQALLGSGKASQDLVVRQFGPPSGEFVYPLTLSPDTHGYQYEYVGINKADRKLIQKRLRILFGQDGRVVDYKASFKDVTIPARFRTPVPVLVPVIVPHR